MQWTPTKYGDAVAHPVPLDERGRERHAKRHRTLVELVPGVGVGLVRQAKVAKRVLVEPTLHGDGSPGVCDRARSTMSASPLIAALYARYESSSARVRIHRRVLTQLASSMRTSHVCPVTSCTIRGSAPAIARTSARVLSTAIA